MKVRLYSNPEGAGWMGWLESCKDQIVGFIRLDGSIAWEWQNLLRYIKGANCGR